MFSFLGLAVFFSKASVKLHNGKADVVVNSFTRTLVIPDEVMGRGVVAIAAEIEVRLVRQEHMAFFAKLREE